MSSEHKYALPPGFRLRQYIIARLLGHGGFGLTYLADDTKLNRNVAIKELLPVDFAIREVDGTTVVARSQQDKSNFKWARQRFVEEGQTLAGLHHPSILPIHEIVEEHGTAYLVTAFIEGGTLVDWLREVQHPSEGDLRSITLCLLDALELVHERGHLHRDVKPENILMDRRNRRPILIDFGNARVAVGGKTSNLTAVLTKGYAPFEQYQTKGRQGAFSDLYSLGAVLYRAIKGIAPEDAADRWEDDRVEPLCQRPPVGYSHQFLATVDKALQMRREDRWQQCGEWKAALSVPVEPPPLSPPAPAPEPEPTPQPPFTSKLQVAEPRLEHLRTQQASTAPPPPPSTPNLTPPLPAPKPQKASNPLRWIVLWIAAIPLAILGLVVIMIMLDSWGSKSRPKPAGSDSNPRSTASQPEPSESDIKTKSATKEAPFVNSLGQEFVPVPGTNVLFCRWDTRASDWQAFVQETNDIAPWGLFGLDEKVVKWVYKKDSAWNHPSFKQTGQHPVVGVSWDDAHRFCWWLSRKEHRTYRLATDAEWSAAVGAQTYPWGNTFPPFEGAGNYSGSESRLKTDASGTTAWQTIDGYNDVYPRTSPVARFVENEYGLYDMGGNVWQWCEDEYKASMNSAEVLEKYPFLRNEKASEETGERAPRVLRGASWGNGDEIHLRSSYRAFVPPSERREDVGFRCVLMVSNSDHWKPKPIIATAAAKPRASTPPPPPSPTTNPAGLTGLPALATMEKPFANSLGMRFVPVPITGGPTDGQKILFSVWDTRVQDYEVFAQETQRQHDKPGFEQGPTHPVVMVHWDDAAAFCDWLTLRERRSGQISEGARYRLPGDHEWSCAAEIGGKENAVSSPNEKDGKIDGYPWGAAWPPPENAGNYGETLAVDRFRNTSPVGAFKANRYGLYDMGGNVWQWCQDWYDPAFRGYAILRGGSWINNDEISLRSSRRESAHLKYLSNNYGFRCVLEVPDGDHEKPAPIIATAAAKPRASTPPPPPPSPTANPAGLTGLLALATMKKPFANSLGMKFVPVPITGGPTHGQKTLFSVWDTRVQDYEIFVRETRHRYQTPGFAQGPTHPVVMVHWDDAAAFCDWLTLRERRSGQISGGTKYRLPSDHEWSCAAGIGAEENAVSSSQEKDGKLGGYPWGTAWPPPENAGNYGETLAVDRFTNTSPVGTFKANRYGLYDMGGNVWQWCQDWYDPSSRDSAVLRGGSWINNDEISLRSSHREGAHLRDRSNNYGFRCVLVASDN